MPRGVPKAGQGCAGIFILAILLFGLFYEISNCIGGSDADGNLNMQPTPTGTVTPIPIKTPALLVE